jgi:hypothetical protein
MNRDSLSGVVSNKMFFSEQLSASVINLLKTIKKKTKQNGFKRSFNFADIQLLLLPIFN